VKLPFELPEGEGAEVDLVALGECSLDQVGVLAGWPRPDEKRGLQTLAACPGGQAATAALACRRLGWRSRYVGCVGTDEAAGPTLAGLRRAGVDVQAVVRQAMTRQAIVLVDAESQTRTVLEHRDVALALNASDVRREWVVTGRLLLVDATSPSAAIEAARIARTQGLPVMADIDGPGTGVSDLLALVDILVVSSSALTRLTGGDPLGAALRRLVGGLTTRLVIVTMGREGSVAFAEGREIHTPAPVVEVVDTTGAGDAFRAGFAAGWFHHGRDADLEDVLGYANAVAALSCRGLGAQGGLPTADEVRWACDQRGQ